MLFGVLFCGSIGAVSSSINRLLLFLFHASRFICCIFCVFPHLPLLFFCITFRCSRVQDYAYDHYAYMYINTIMSFCRPQLLKAVLMSPETPSVGRKVVAERQRLQSRCYSWSRCTRSMNTRYDACGYYKAYDSTGCKNPEIRERNTRENR